ncbi:indolepyruvate decarboxylase [Motilibacter peucedani]|uniref:Alpha-keto-acid decarboxylase n=1 Tax=Motilibacter peucedani TaxID=598650 RepID=A0A420XPF9_9ACTN|nr:indolepyruvate decarboxylase [Motilibacter peucedani]
MDDTSDRSAGAATLPLAAYLARRLRQLGVDHVFGLPGDFSMGLLDGMLEGTGLEWVGTTNELNAAYAADGYARLRGFGALVTTYGVGELSALNGVAGAYAESVPLVQVTGAPPRGAARGGSLVHHSLVDGDLGHFARAYAEVTAAAEVLEEASAAEQVDRLLTSALRELRPVYLSVPSDLTALPVPAARLQQPLARPASDPHALALLGEALRSRLAGGAPVTLLAGHLVRRRGLGQVVRRLADAGVTVATLLGAKGLLDEDHRSSAGTYVGALTADKATRRAVEHAPLLVLAGAVLSDLSTGMFSAELDESSAVVLGLREARVGDLRVADVDLADSLELLADLVAPHEEADRPLDQAGLWATLQSWLPAGTPLLADAGTAYFGAAELALPRGTELVGQPIWASIGYTLPALLGAALADPTRRPVLVIGDGAAQLTVQELATVLQRGLRPVVVLIDNGGYTVERAIRSPQATYHDITDWDWGSLATALGGAHPPLVLPAGTRAELAAALGTAGATPGRAVLVHAVLPRHDVPALLSAIATGLSASHDAGADDVVGQPA